MDNSWSCQYCGGSEYHFDNHRGIVVCSTCGREVRTQEQRSADIKFFEAITLAKRHLKVGNWEEAKRLVKAYCNVRPDDKTLYLILLAASTKCYSDYRMDDDRERSEASECWDKLERLHCVNSLMRQYASKRYAYLNSKRETIMYKKGILFGLSLILTLTTIVLFASGEASGFIFAVFTVISWKIFIGNMGKWDEILEALPLNKLHEGRNPFM